MIMQTFTNGLHEKQQASPVTSNVLDNGTPEMFARCKYNNYACKLYCSGNYMVLQHQ
jgi:hypothetical protein